MEYKELAGTGEKLSEIGLGTWLYRGGEKPLRRGIDLGVNVIDTAEAYGTEEDVGKAVRSIRHQVFLATKVSPGHFRRDALLRACNDSLKRLKTDYVDLYQLHWPNPDIPIAETMDAMERLVRAGKVRHIGVSNFSVDQVKEAQAALSLARIVSNQVEYSLVERSIEADILPHCQESDITVIAYSPLGQGFSNIVSADKRGVLKKVAAESGYTPVQIALNWVISRPGVIAIPKSGSLQHTEENCRASGWRLSEDHVALLNEAFS